MSIYDLHMKVFALSVEIVSSASNPKCKLEGKLDSFCRKWILMCEVESSMSNHCDIKRKVHQLGGREPPEKGRRPGSRDNVRWCQYL
eukprot:1159902-Pelagomonas_calceolata.AAC.6